MKSKNVLFFALARFNGQYSSTAKSIALEWAKYHRIFYLDNPYTLKDLLLFKDSFIFQNWKAIILGLGAYEVKHNNFIYIYPPVIIPINWLPDGKIYRFLNKLNNLLVYRRAKKILKKFKAHQFIFFNSFNPFYRLKQLNPEITIYQSVDDIGQSEYISRHGPRHELRFVKSADLTFVTSSALQKKYADFSNRVYKVANAANFELFKKAFKDNTLKRPIDFPDGNNKTIIYTGNICHRVDYTLLLELVDQLKDVNLLLVGPVNYKGEEIGSLQQKENVFFIGRKELEELPAYLRYADCAIIPFKVNQLTNSIYPLKVNEYLAAGLPVVSTIFSDDILGFKDILYLATNSMEFVEGSREALNDNGFENVKKRVEIASNNTWESRVKELDQIVTRYLANDA